MRRNSSEERASFEDLVEERTVKCIVLHRETSFVNSGEQGSFTSSCSGIVVDKKRV